MISSNQFLFFSVLVYWIVGMIDVFVYKFIETEYLSAIWCIWLCLPVFIPMGGIVRGAPLWRNK